MTVVARKEKKLTETNLEQTRSTRAVHFAVDCKAIPGKPNLRLSTRDHIYSDWISSFTHASGNAECGKSIIFISSQSSATLNYKFFEKDVECAPLDSPQWNRRNANLVKRTSRLHNFNINVKHIGYVWHYFHICPQQDGWKRNSNRKILYLGDDEGEKSDFHLNKPVSTAKK